MKFLTHHLQVLYQFYEHTEYQLVLKPILRKLKPITLFFC